PEVELVLGWNPIQHIRSSASHRPPISVLNRSVSPLIRTALILSVLAAFPFPLSAKQINGTLHRPAKGLETLRRQLKRMVSHGILHQPQRGKYAAKGTNTVVTHECPRFSGSVEISTQLAEEMKLTSIILSRLASDLSLDAVRTIPEDRVDAGYTRRAWGEYRRLRAEAEAIAEIDYDLYCDPSTYPALKAEIIEVLAAHRLNLGTELAVLRTSRYIATWPEEESVRDCEQDTIARLWVEQDAERRAWFSQFPVCAKSIAQARAGKEAA
ncbi:MAG: hypothetical protein ABSC05_36780, partial [Candidatus Solibacter sp.]